jgi:hypothetical protein
MKCISLENNYIVQLQSSTCFLLNNNLKVLLKQSVSTIEQMGITEVAFLPLQHGKAVGDPTSPAGKIHEDCLDILLSQKGCQRAHWGVQVETPSLLLWFVDWDRIEDHIEFTKAK